MNYIDAQKGMTKEALAAPKFLSRLIAKAGRGVKLGPHAANAQEYNLRIIRALRDPKIQQAFRSGKHSRSLAKILDISPRTRLALGVLADIPGGAKTVGTAMWKHPWKTGLTATGLSGLYALLLGRDFLAPVKGGIKNTFHAAGNAFAEGANEVGKALNTPSNIPLATTNFSWKNLANTFNPASGITGGINYVPAGLVKAIQKVLPGHGGELAAYTATKVGASALLAAGLVGAYRLARHVGDMGAIDSKGSAGKDMSSQLSTTFSGNLGDGEEDKKQKKAASLIFFEGSDEGIQAQPNYTYKLRSNSGALTLEQYKQIMKYMREGNMFVPRGWTLTSTPTEEQKKVAAEGDIMAPANFSVQNLTGTALPLASMLLAAGLTYKGIDAAFDKIRNKRLDNAIAQKEQAVKNLITARAKLAKGELSDTAVQNAVAPIANKDIYTKAASQDKEAVVQEAVQLFGTLSAAVILASAIGSYAYTSAADENNIKYKAYKKALRTYAKNKSGMTPITVAPSDAASYFASIDAAKDQKPVTPRNMPNYDPDSLNKPISTSF